MGHHTTSPVSCYLTSWTLLITQAWNLNATGHCHCCGQLLQPNSPIQSHKIWICYWTPTLRFKPDAINILVTQTFLYLCSGGIIILFVKLTHWGRVMHIYISKLTIFGSDNGMSPDRRQAIIWTNAGLLLIGPLGTNFSEILIKILAFSFKKMRLKVSSVKQRPFCLCLNVLTFECGLWMFLRNNRNF